MREVTVTTDKYTYTQSDSKAHRTYHLAVPVQHGYFWDAGSGGNGFHNLPNQGEPPPTAKALAQVRGMQSFYFHDGYELSVHRAELYGWEQLGPQIEAVVAQHNATAAWPAYEDSKPAATAAWQAATYEDEDETQAVGGEG